MLSACTSKRPRIAPVDPIASSLANRMSAAVYRNPSLSYAIPYRLFTPGFLQASARYPLVVYLHGAAGRGDDNLRHLGQDIQRMLLPEVQALSPFFLLAPQCPEGDEWINRHQTPPFSTYDQARFRESDAAKATFEILRSLVDSQLVDPNRIYVTGPSMGGSGTWDFITRHPGIFAAAIPVTGVGDPSRAEVIVDLPIWAFHGTLDTVSPIANIRAMKRALAAAGSTRARFSELQGVGHDSWNHAYSQIETYRWLFEQRRPQL